MKKIYRIDFDKLKSFDNTRESIFQQVRWQLKKEKAKGVKCCIDFYDAIGVDFEDLQEEKGSRLSCSDNIFANDNTWNKVTDLVKSLYKDNYKNRGKDVVWSAVLMDLMDLSPNTSKYQDEIPEDELWIVWD